MEIINDWLDSSNIATNELQKKAKSKLRIYKIISATYYIIIFITLTASSVINFLEYGESDIKQIMARWITLETLGKIQGGLSIAILSLIFSIQKYLKPDQMIRKMKLIIDNCNSTNSLIYQYQDLGNFIENQDFNDIKMKISSSITNIKELLKLDISSFRLIRDLMQSKLNKKGLDKQPLLNDGSDN